MTESEALAKFWFAYPAAAKNRHLKVNDLGWIRGDDDCCPVTATWWKHGHEGAGCAGHIAREEGLRYSDGLGIQLAADNRPGHDPAIRARLLAALEKGTGDDSAMAPKAH